MSEQETDASKGSTGSRALVCIVVACLIGVWQLSFHFHAAQIDGSFWNVGSTGLSGDLRVFFNFYWNLGYFPLGTNFEVPPEALRAAVGSYFSAVIESPTDRSKTVTVTIRKTETGYRVVGCTRG